MQNDLVIMISHELAHCSLLKLCNLLYTQCLKRTIFLALNYLVAATQKKHAKIEKKQTKNYKNSVTMTKAHITKGEYKTTSPFDGILRVLQDTPAERLTCNNKLFESFLNTFSHSTGSHEVEMPTTDFGMEAKQAK